MTMEVILYYDKEGRKQWIIAEKGSNVVNELLKMGYREEDFLIIDATGQITEDIEDRFGY